MWRFAASLAFGAAVPGGADDFEVTWQATAGCPSQPAVLREIRDLVGDRSENETPSTPATVGLSVDGSAHATEEGFEVVVTLQDRRSGDSEVRRFHDPSCATATRMAVVLASVAIRTRREQTAAADPPPTSPKPDSAPVLEVREPPAAVDERRRLPSAGPRHRPRLELSAGAVLDPISTGALTAGPRLGVRLRWRRAALHARGMYLLPRRIEFDAGLGAEISLGAAEVQGCWVQRDQALSFGACGGIELGALRARGFGLPQNRVDHALWATASVGLSVSVSLHPRVEIAVEPEFLAPLVRSQVRFESPLPPIYEVVAVGGRMGVTVLVWLRPHRG